jgi:hypothetical protein
MDFSFLSVFIRVHLWLNLPCFYWRSSIRDLFGRAQVEGRSAFKNWRARDEVNRKRVEEARG